MLKLVIIGQVPAVITVVQEISQSEQDWEITVILPEQCGIYDRSQMPQWIAHKIKEKNVMRDVESFFKSANVTVVADKEMSRINFIRKKIFLSGRAQIDFDALIMADVPQVRFDGVKGAKKSGVFHLARLDSVRALIKMVPLVETITVEVTSLRGLEAVIALADKKKDVIVLSPEESLLVGVLGKDLSCLVTQVCKNKKIRIISGEKVVDILGEGEVRAIRLSSGKVMSADMLVIEDVVPDLRIFTDTGLSYEERVFVDSSMRTNMDNVFAIDALLCLKDSGYCGHYGLSEENVILQAKVAVQTLLGRESVFVVPEIDMFAECKHILSAEAVQQARADLKPGSSFHENEEGESQEILIAPQGGLEYE